VAESNINPTAETDLGYGQLFGILWRRRFWLLAIFNAVLVSAGFITLLQKPTYMSKMQLLVEPNYQESQRPELEPRNPSDRQRDIDYATQLNLMRSAPFLEKAVESLQSEYPDLTVKDVQLALTLGQVSEGEIETRIFQLSYVDDDPIKTQKMLQALQAVYQDYNLEQQELRIRQGLTFLNGQLSVIRRELGSSQDDLEQFRREQNLIDPEQEAIAASQALNQVRLEQRSVQAEYQEAQAQSLALQQQLSLSPEQALVASRLSQSDRIQNILNALQETELGLVQQQVIFRDDTPDVEVLLDQRQSQITLLNQEINRVLGSEFAGLVPRGEGALSAGQLSQIDLGLVGQLAEAQTRLQGLEARRRVLTLTEQILREELNEFPELIAEYSRLKPEVDIEQAILQQLIEERQRLSAELAGGGFNWQVVEVPQVGGKVGPDLKRNMLLGVVAGLFLGCVAAFIRESLDRVVHTSDDLKKQTALPLLGILPEMSSEEKRSGLALFNRAQSMIATDDPNAHWMPFREALDLIYKNIQLLRSSNAPLSIVITSALAGEGKSTLVLGLALSAARSHQRVLVIDADLRRPVLHERLDIPNEHGLSVLLEQSRLPLRPIRLTIMGSQIDVIPAGPEPSDPVRLLSSQRMRQLMAIFEEKYDLVLIDAPPIVGRVDAVEIASVCSGVVMVGRLDRVTQAELSQATAMLNQLNVLGIVANGAKSYPGQYDSYTHRNERVLAQRGRAARNGDYQQN
jgi:polysaccharide biosynthesis transport protein